VARHRPTAAASSIDKNIPCHPRTSRAPVSGMRNWRPLLFNKTGGKICAHKHKTGNKNNNINNNYYFLSIALYLCCSVFEQKNFIASLLSWIALVVWCILLRPSHVQFLTCGLKKRMQFSRFICFNHLYCMLSATFIRRKTVEVHDKYKTIQWQYEKQKNNTTYTCCIYRYSYI